MALAVVGLPLAADGLVALSGARGAFGCRVVQVVDGDTVRLWCPGRGIERVRFTGYDTPEKYSPQCGSEFLRAEAATWMLRWALVRGTLLTTQRMGTDRYGRSLVRAHVDGVPAGRALIEMRLARPYHGGPRAGWCNA